MKKSPRKARAHFQLAMAYYGAHRCQDAEERFETVAQLEKPDYRLLVDWALADFCLNKNDEALQKLQQAAALEKTAHVYTQIAMVHAKTGKIAEAFQALRCWSIYHAFILSLCLSTCRHRSRTTRKPIRLRRQSRPLTN